MSNIRKPTAAEDSRIRKMVAEFGPRGIRARSGEARFATSGVPDESADDGYPIIVPGLIRNILDQSKGRYCLVDTTGMPWVEAEKLRALVREQTSKPRGPINDPE